MAQVVTRANLSQMAFPFLSEFSGRGIVVKQTDQNYVASVTSKEDLDKDIGIPSLYYCHNIIATTQGYESISYQNVAAAISGMTTFVQDFPVIDANGSRAYIGVDAAGNFYARKDPYYSWDLLVAIPEAAGKVITKGYVNGITYFYVEQVGCYKFDFTSNSIVPVVLTGLVAAEVLGIVAVAGYLIAWSKNAIAWSSLIEPTDFEPSLVTGAGGGPVQGVRGSIVACVSHTIGFVIYTNQNAVAAVSSGNSRFPFNFRELVASGGLASIELVTYDANSGNHYVYTTSGVQLISLQQAQTVLPELTDFLAGSVFEDFNETTNIFSVIHLTTTLKKKLALVSDRYLIFSYGVLEFTHALVYDLATKRWGKLRHTHVQVSEYALLKAELVETPRRSIALLKKDGSVDVVKIDSRDSANNGVVLLGKFQYIRQRLTQLQSVTVENCSDSGAFSCIDLYTLDGKNPLQAVGYLAEAAGLVRKYLFSCVGVNHSLLFKGAFHLVSLVLNYNIHGRR